MKEMLGYQKDEVASASRMPPRTIECYVLKVLTFGEVKASTIGTLIITVVPCTHNGIF